MGRKAKDGKKKKDPNAPKRPAGGAYGVWLAENRPRIVSSLPQGHKITDVTKAAGEQWKALSDAAKKPYEAKYAKKQEEYEMTMKRKKRRWKLRRQPNKAALRRRKLARLAREN